MLRVNQHKFSDIKTFQILETWKVWAIKLLFVDLDSLQSKVFFVHYLMTNQRGNVAIQRLYKF